MARVRTEYQIELRAACESCWRRRELVHGATVLSVLDASIILSTPDACPHCRHTIIILRPTTSSISTQCDQKA